MTSAFVHPLTGTLTPASEENLRAAWDETEQEIRRLRAALAPVLRGLGLSRESAAYWTGGAA